MFTGNLSESIDRMWLVQEPKDALIKFIHFQFATSAVLNAEKHTADDACV